MKYFDVLKKALQKVKTKHNIQVSEALLIPDLVYNIIQVTLDIIDEKTFKRLNDSKFKILFKTEIIKFEDHDKLLASANLKDNTIDLHLDLQKLDKNEYLCQIVHSILHEIGHLIFFSALETCKFDSSLKQNILKFIELCNKYKSFSDLAEKYIKEIYGVKVRQNNLHLIRGVDIKYHESFAEVFRIYHVHKLDKRLDPKIKISIPQELLESYESISICLSS